MKLKDLLKQLKDADPESDLFFNLDDGCCGDYEQLGDPYEIDIDEPGKYFPNGRVQIRFEALWFNDSCITAGTAKKAALAHKKRFKGDQWEPGDK